jgi:hypothetical protein
MDLAAAVHMFRILKRNNEQFDFNELPGWLVDRNWGSHHADQITQLAREIYAGKKRQAGQNPWGSQAIRTWRMRARKSKVNCVSILGHSDEQDAALNE